MGPRYGPNAKVVLIVEQSARNDRLPHKIYFGANPASTRNNGANARLIIGNGVPLVKNSIRTGLLSSVFVTSAVALSMATAIPAIAQVTTSEIVGTVTSETGAAISGAVVTVQNIQTGLVRTVTTDGSGGFAARNLPVTGLYNVSATRSGFQGERVEEIALSLGGGTAFNFVLSNEVGEDEIIVVAQQTVVADIAIGPSATFGKIQLENAPAINRNIADVIRLDPRVYIDESRGGINSVQCVGQSSRFNSITLDGVAINDSFGLNANGYPTERMPFPYDAVEQVSVEIAPFDVKYGGFTACNINAVTKSGTNEMHGGAFMDYTSDGLRGSKIDGESGFDFDDFDELRYGLSLNGPIVEDTLFFSLAYEKLEGANTYSRQALGTGAFQLSQADVDRIATISNNVYRYDPGFIPSSFDNEDEKIFAKLDWNITNGHRASLSYDYNDGNNFVRSDGDSDELEFSNHLYERGAKLHSVVGAVYSDWNDRLSTELRVGYLDLDNRQVSVGGTDFGEIQIDTGDVTVYLGGDDSRQSNNLDYSLLDTSLRASYDMGRHTISAGLERKELDIFNLFIQHSETEIRFDDIDLDGDGIRESAIDAFEAGVATEIYYNNAPSHNPDDAAADWGYAINTMYLQDDFEVTDALSVVAGLRYDWYSSSDVPTENPGFTAEYGFSNSQNFDGEGLLQPRLGFTYDASNELQLRGGVGRYSGGNPNVWLSNNYSSNNITQVGARARDFSGIDLFGLTYVDGEDGVPNGPGYAIPTGLHDDVSSGSGRNFEINYIDPEFKIPSDWKASFGATWEPDLSDSTDFLFQADLLYSQSENTAIIQRGDLVQTGTRTVTDETGLITGSWTIPTYGTLPSVSDPNDTRQASFELTNADKSNRAFVASLGMQAQTDNGMRFSLGYAYSDAKDVQPMTSSVAFSNYNNRAYIDPQEQILSTSNYNIKHRITGSASFKKDVIFDDYDTGIYAFFQSSSGRPYSRVYQPDNAIELPDGREQPGLFDFYGFSPFLSNSGNILLPGTERNQFNGPWWTKVDLKLTQDVPGFGDGHRAQVFVVVDNLTNLISSDLGVLRTPSFPRTLQQDQPYSLVEDASLYEIRFGAKYDF